MNNPFPSAETYQEFFARATQSPDAPFEYQRRLAASNWPDVLHIPTGLGKTSAVVLAWLYKRLALNDINTPRRLVYCLPMRVLVEQTQQECDRWLRNVGAFGETGEGKVSLHCLMGGSEDLRKPIWAEHPEEEQILIGTQDMLLSRALMRGYGMSRYHWPVHFAMLHNDAMWVFDEVQLMGPGLVTSVQLDAFRRSIKGARNSRSLWVSATFNPAWLNTVDFDSAHIIQFQLTEQEKASQRISARCNSTKPLTKSTVSLEADGKSAVAKYVAAISAQIIDAHRRGTTTLAILNTVDRAQATFNEITSQLAPASPKTKKRDLQAPLKPLSSAMPECLLVHSRFRSKERAALNRRLSIRPDLNGEGRIIVATQAVEAGVDLSARVLFTELAPWTSMVQRFGRCNRYGEFNETGEARVVWINIADPTPYEIEMVDDARRLLGALTDASPSSLPSTAIGAPLYPVLRRKDFNDLFSTDADLSGFDTDIGQYVRDTDDADVLLFWRLWVSDGEARSQAAPAEDELCRSGLSSATKLLSRLRNGDVYRWDALSREWTPFPNLNKPRLRPGMMLMLNTSAGGYLAKQGLTPDSTLHVPVDANTATLTLEAADDDHRSLLNRAVTLPRHLADAEDAARHLCEALSVTEARAVICAARWHDAGKAHPAFQSMLLTAHRQGTGMDLGPGLWAKSGRTIDIPTGSARTPGRPKYQVEGEGNQRKHFRHELASALAWLAEHDGEADSDLIAYLIAAHHGKVRLSLRALPNETEPPDHRPFARGVWHGDLLPEVRLDDGSALLPATTLDLGIMRLGEGSRGPSWTTRTHRLLNSYGPFRLSWLETLVRIADWRATRREQENGADR